MSDCSHLINKKKKKKELKALPGSGSRDVNRLASSGSSYSHARVQARMTVQVWGESQRRAPAVLQSGGHMRLVGHTGRGGATGFHLIHHHTRTRGTARAQCDKNKQTKVQFHMNAAVFIPMLTDIQCIFNKHI